MKTPFPNRTLWQVASCFVLPLTALAVNDVTVQNTTYTSGQVVTVVADNSVTATPAVVVSSGADVMFLAGARVTLGAGFKVATGGLFYANVGLFQPYWSGFESADGFSTGSVHGQRGWTVTQGTAEVVTAEQVEGSRGLALQSGGTPAIAGIGLLDSSASTVTFVDLYLKPVATTTAAGSSLVQTESAKVGFQIASGQGEVYVYDGVGANQWLATGYRFNTNGSNQATAWHRLTLRLDYTAKKWDLFADGIMINYDLGFLSSSESFFRQLTLQGVASAAAYADAIYASDTNPLFTDADKDGMDDAWETAHGLNPAVNDRNGNLDSDSFTNLQEYLLGTHPNNADVTPPSAPTGLALVSSTPTSLTVSWSASTDAGAGTPGVAGYHLYRDDHRVNTTLITTTGYTDTGLVTGIPYAYTVRAVDLAGNLSGSSGGLTVTPTTTSSGTVEYTYDTSGRLTQAKYVGVATQNYTHTAASNLSQVSTTQP